MPKLMFATHTVTHTAGRDAPRPAVWVTPVAATMAMVLLGLQLRPAISAVGAVMPALAVEIPAGVLTLVVAAPLGCFAVGGLLAWVAQARWGAVRSITGALAVLSTALAARALGDGLVLLAGTIAACVAMAVVSTLVPAVTRTVAVAERGRLMAASSIGVGTGTAAGGLLTGLLLAPLSGWRVGLAAWAILAAAGLLVWVAQCDRFTDVTSTVPATTRARPWQVRPRGGMVALVVHFGALAGAAFALLGWLATLLTDSVPIGHATAVVLFGVATAAGIPILGPVATRTHRPGGHRLLVAGLAAAGTAGVAVLLAAPVLPGPAWLWATVAAVAIGLSFPSNILALSLVPARSADPHTATAVSSVMHAGGYALAGLIVLGLGQLHTATGSWTAPLIALLGVLAIQTATGLIAARPGSSFAVDAITTVTATTSPNGGDS